MESIYSAAAGYKLPPGMPGIGLYTATKTMVEEITEGTRRELRAKKLPIRACVICF